ncbi:serine hydrolase domain-containing protein [Saccharopolyspora erythraea]|uniref:serine hydrolase domain-containing protein n=1 Tax=Saccharopolyspora erythraea TaxID=1836 RepID=UPI00049532BD|nr:serine hydrolase domain-containing protein [Saccharopolyspora erythraea]QRK93124.1 beta-lactamase family protein [Saccharopolyspora erythraea]
MQPRGTVEPRFDRVREVFAELLDSGQETGAGLSVWFEGRRVVDLHGGWADTARTRPWQSDTLVHTFSVSKPFAALATLVVLARNDIALDTPVADLWPDYAAAGKAATTLRQVLSHQAGQPTFPATTAGLFDDEELRAALAAAPPEWEPGTAIAEHALTYGHLLDGVVRAVTGRSLGAVWRDDVAGPLRMDAHFGVPESGLARVADLEPAAPESWRFGSDGNPVDRALSVPSDAREVWVLNSERWRRAEFPAIGLHARADALARFFADLPSPDGPVAALLGRELHKEFLAPQVSGRDLFLGYDLTWTLGLQRSDTEIAMGGLGGCVAWVSLRHGYSCAYLTRYLSGPHRVMALEEAIESAF